jgi:hypothetical protein
LRSSLERFDVDDDVWAFSRGVVRKEGVRYRHIGHGLEVFEAQFCIYSLFTIPFLFDFFYLGNHDDEISIHNALPSMIFRLM